MDPIEQALRNAETAAFTRNPPKTVRGQLSFLSRQVKGSTRKLAELLGVSQRSAQRYLKGEQAPRTAAAKERLDRAVRERWQPRVRERARKQAARGGVVVEIRARLGYTAPVGTTDEARVRHLTQALPPAYAQPLLDARTEEERKQILGEGFGYAYFRDGGRRAEGLGVEVQEIDFVDISFL